MVTDMQYVGIPSKKENKCPVCGHEQPVRYMYGDPETCDKCGNTVERKQYYHPFGCPSTERYRL
jgi:ribosomal protein L37AE/L43A